MLQQTQVKTVGDYYERWMVRFADVRSLAAAQLEQVLKLWEGLGYYGRARNLHRAAQMVVNERNGVLPQSYVEWLELPGVGPYTAAAVASIACGEHVAAVDGNVLRTYARFTGFESSIDGHGVREQVKEQLELILEDAADFNQALMDLGREICTPKAPVCEKCPLKGSCFAFREDRQSALPIRRSRGKTPEYRIVVGLIQKEGRVLIQQRKPEGLLGGLWEFPGGKVQEGETLAESLAREVLEETDMKVKVLEEIATIKHAYTHFKIQMTAFWCTYRSGELKLRAATQAKWVRVEEFEDFAFPKANHKIFNEMKLD